MNDLRHMSRLILLGFVVVAALCVGCAPVRITQTAGLISLPVEGTGSFARASSGRTFTFPQDHGPHFEFQTEWWYYTGNLCAEDGSRFGYQLTFFRRGLQPPSLASTRTSDWATDQVYMAHFTITTVEDAGFRYYERLERGAAGLAGARSDPSYSVWLLNWSVEQSGPATFHLKVTEEEISLQLELQDQAQPVLQGEAGYSRKGMQPGNASYYYSQPRLLTSGRLTIAGKSYQVKGESWMDHEFGTSALEENQVGWDWFALTLDDGSSLMVATLRNANGELSEYSQGLLILPDGGTRSLARDDFRITVTGNWLSPNSGAEYPAGWLIEVPGEDLKLEITPFVPDQELRVSFIYWEGAVRVQGTRNGQAVIGRGYVELTGYAHSMQGKL
jgi:predicted secreted hydrolase